MRRSPEDNPYTPNAGARPPLLAGRAEELDAFDLLLRRLQRGYTAQSMIVIGLRGVGKTVLLGEFLARARERGWTTVDAEITKHEDFGQRMAMLARRALLQVAPRARWKERGRRAAQVLRSFQLTVSSEGEVSASLRDVEPLEGMADSGVWDLGQGSQITLAEVQEAQELVEAKLDGGFFKVRAERTTDLELQYLRAMAELGPKPQLARDVAKLLQRTSEQLGPTRARLIDKGLLYTPGFGLAAFTVPQFDRYMRRAHKLVVPPVQARRK